MNTSTHTITHTHTHTNMLHTHRDYVIILQIRDSYHSNHNHCQKRICVGDPVHTVIVDPKNKIRNEVNTKESCCAPETVSFSGLKRGVGAGVVPVVGAGVGARVVLVVGTVVVVVAARALHFEGEHIQYSGLTHAPRWFAGSFDMPNGQQGGSAPLFVMAMCRVKTVEVPQLSLTSYSHCQMVPGRSNFTMVLSISVSFLNTDIVLAKDWDAILA